MRVAQSVAGLLALSLAIPASGAPLRLRLGWDEMRDVVGHAEISPRVVVWSGADGHRRVIGHLAGIEDGGIRLTKRGGKRSRFVQRQAVFAIRLMPQKGERFTGHPYRWRIAAVFAAAPVWFYGYIVGVMIPHGIREGRLFKLKNSWQGYALATPVVYGLYRWARWADRRRGAIVIELDHEKEQATP